MEKEENVSEKKVRATIANQPDGKVKYYIQKPAPYVRICLCERLAIVGRLLIIVGGSI